MDSTFLSETNLFKGISPEAITAMLPCLDARTKSYKKEDCIFLAGDQIHEIGLVLSGSVNIVADFYWGTSHIFGHFEKGEIFAENYAAIPNKELPVSVIAAKDCEVLFLDMQKMMTTCQKVCASHQSLSKNLLMISAKKNLNLSSRMMHTASKSIRGRLLSYLSEQAINHGSNKFQIPFNRQQLADYLAVDRSAMSNELSKMQKEGLIQFHKNEFVLNELS
ncbi:MAG: Crp/Fnr family transcriptional regulator [Lachnospiraceae bacterium]|nr:Crp/Fnr family transcriptional regulator [Lachnospiraceae bacterium]